MFLVLFKLVPGASAIRSGYRAMIVANFFAAVSVALAISRISLMSSRYGEADLKIKLTRVAVVALMVLGVAEQINLTQNSLVSRRFERGHFANVSAAPIDCKSFYIASEPQQPATIVQIDAMLVAQRVGIPTLNGYSGNLPLDELYDLHRCQLRAKRARVGGTSWYRSRPMPLRHCGPGIFSIIR